MSLVELARFDNRVEAELARLNLEAEGIDAILFDADMHSFGWGTDRADQADGARGGPDRRSPAVAGALEQMRDRSRVDSGGPEPVLHLHARPSRVVHGQGPGQ
jgi:hypothetical protein